MSQDLYKGTNEDLYKEKYLKYKSKYLSLKNVGGKFTSGTYFFYVPPSVFNMIALFIYVNQLKEPNKSVSKKTSKVDIPTSIEGPLSSVLEKIIIDNELPSYIIKLGESIYSNSKDIQKNNLFGPTTKKFGFKDTESQASQASKKKIQTSDEQIIKSDIYTFKTTININEYKLIHCKIESNKPSLIYASEYSTISQEEHPILKQIEQLKSEIKKIPIVNK